MAVSPAVPSAFTRSFRAIGLAVGAALVFTFYLAVDLGGTVRGVPRIESAIVAAVWVGPFLIYAAAVRTAWMAVLGGVALLAPTAGFLVAMFASTSSTSAIGMITVPMLTYPLAVIVWGLDRVLLAWTSGDRSRVSAQLAVCSVLVGAVAALFGATAVAKLTNTTTGDHPLPLAATVVTATTAVALMVASTRLARSQRMVSSGR